MTKCATHKTDQSSSICPELCIVIFGIGVLALLITILDYNYSNSPEGIRDRALYEIDLQQVSERPVYTAGTEEWYQAANPDEINAYFNNICQNELGLEPGKPLFKHCMQREEDFFTQRIQIRNTAIDN